MTDDIAQSDNGSVSDFSVRRFVRDDLKGQEDSSMRMIGPVENSVPNLHS